MSEPTPDLGAMVSKLLGNPELISQIVSTVGIDAPSGKGEEPPSADVPAAAPPGVGAGGLDALLPMISMLGGSGGGGGGTGARRCALLSALKPFCNEHRCKTIDYMIGISKLSDTFIPSKRG